MKKSKTISKADEAKLTALLARSFAASRVQLARAMNQTAAAFWKGFDTGRAVERELAR